MTPPGAPHSNCPSASSGAFSASAIFDDCRAKCAMTTTIEADVAYTHLICNGNIDPSTTPTAFPAQAGSPDRISSLPQPVPMAPYLFSCARALGPPADKVTFDSGALLPSNTRPPGSSKGPCPDGNSEKIRPLDKSTQDYEYTGDNYGPFA